jgi:copper(I)-binding protein
LRPDGCEDVKEAVKVTRWTRRLLVGVVAVLVPALAGCEAGLNAPTQEYHPASNGARDTHNGITISNLFVLGPALNDTLPSGGRAGVFLAITTQKPDQLTSVSAPGTATSVKLIGGPVTLTPGTLTDLTGPQPVIVLNDLRRPLAGGQTIPLVLDFANAGALTIQVPVEPHSYEYATFSPPAAVKPTATAKPGVSVSPSPGATASQGGNQPTSTPSPSGTP